MIWIGSFCMCWTPLRRESCPGNRDHFVYVSSQWETTLPCNVVSHWLDTYTKWSLVIMMSTWSSLVAPKVVVMTSRRTPSDIKVRIMATLDFHLLSISKHISRLSICLASGQYNQTSVNVCSQEMRQAAWLICETCTAKQKQAFTQSRVLAAAEWPLCAPASPRSNSILKLNCQPHKLRQAVFFEDHWP